MNDNPPSATHENLRTLIRNCQTAADFTNVLQSTDFVACLQRVLDSQKDKDPESFTKYWAESLSRNEPWAWDLNHDRKTLTVYYFQVANCWNPAKSPTLSTAQVVAMGKPLKDMIKACLVMDRSNAMYNMIDQAANMRGMHWYGDLPAHREFLINLGAIPMDQVGGHTMNKRYLWFCQQEDLAAPLGFMQDDQVQTWMQPHSSPLRVLSPP